MTHSQQDILSIQALRGIAAILVVFCHSEQYISAFIPVHLERYLGYCFGAFGVDIFFVISGFIMVYISQQDFGQKKIMGPFLLRRFIRIIPLYWLVTLLSLWVILPSGLYAFTMPLKQQAVLEAIKNSDYVLKSFLLIPSDRHAVPIVAVAWTLMFEMFFYYVFSLLLMFNKKIYLPVLCFIFVALTLFSQAIQHFQVTNNLSFYIHFYGNDIILEFMFGCFIAEQYLNSKMLTNTVAVIVLMLSILMLLLSYHDSFINISSIKAIRWGLPSALMVFSLLSLEYNGVLKVPSLFIKLGDASYSIYLFHLSVFLVLFISLLKWMHTFMTIPGDVAVIIAWIGCTIAGYFTYLYVEKPLLKELKKVIYRRKVLSMTKSFSVLEKNS